MPIVRRSLADIDMAAVAAQVRALPPMSDEEIEAQASQAGDVLSEEDWTRAVVVYRAPSPEQVTAVRLRLGLSLVQFARRFGLPIDALERYEQGGSALTGADATLLRVVVAEPEAAMRALHSEAAPG